MIRLFEPFIENSSSIAQAAYLHIRQNGDPVDVQNPGKINVWGKKADEQLPGMVISEDYRHKRLLKEEILGFKPAPQNFLQVTEAHI